MLQKGKLPRVMILIRMETLEQNSFCHLALQNLSDLLNLASCYFGIMTVYDQILNGKFIQTLRVTFQKDNRRGGKERKNKIDFIANKFLFSII